MIEASGLVPDYLPAFSCETLWASQIQQEVNRMEPIVRLTINDDKLVYEQDPKNGWVLEIDRIKFIGEYTTAAGPSGDDWFFVFAEAIDEWWQAPTIAVDHGKFWEHLGQRLNCELAPGLFASTSWATRVIFPKSLEGQELFEIVRNERKPKTIWQKLLNTNDQNERIELTEKVKVLFK